MMDKTRPQRNDVLLPTLGQPIRREIGYPDVDM